MKILVTGFEPFGGEQTNPALEAVKVLPEEIEGNKLIKLELPTVFGKSVDIITKAIEEHQPHVVLSIGQAGGRSAISIERVAINVDDARIPDNQGNQPVDSAIDRQGQPAYFATIPIKAIAAEIRNQGIPAIVSDSAGTFVCNHVMYGVLNYIYKNKLPVKAGFVHIPYLPEQTVNKPSMPSMSLDVIAKGIETAIVTIINTQRDIKAAEGSIC